MARLLTSGAEWNDVTAEGLTITAGTPVSQTSNVRSGARAWGSSTAGDVLTFPFTGVVATTYFFRVATFFTSWASAGLKAPVCDFNNAAGLRPALDVDDSGNVGLYTTTSGATLIGSTTALSLNTWYVLELAVTINTSTNDYAEFRVDGVSIASTTTTDFSITAPTGVKFNQAANGMTCAQDDVALNDSTGAAQNTWPGSSHVVLLVPASDNAKGTGWTNDAATTTNLFNAVHNEPPVGIADTTASTGLHQIRNATSNANVNYDANLTTYTAAGVGAADTVNVLVPIVATAAPVVTSAKAGTYGVASNPAITNVALGAGGTAGAFWSGVAAGTYPTGWKWSFGTTTYAPTVTLGTAPVARITQVTASTRIAMVCAMGLYVDYTPGISALPPLPVYVDSAVARSTSY